MFLRFVSYRAIINERHSNVWTVLVLWIWTRSIERELKQNNNNNKNSDTSRQNKDGQCSRSKLFACLKHNSKTITPKIVSHQSTLAHNFDWIVSSSNDFTHVRWSTIFEGFRQIKIITSFGFAIFPLFMDRSPGEWKTYQIKNLSNSSIFGLKMFFFLGE